MMQTENLHDYLSEYLHQSSFADISFECICQVTLHSITSGLGCVKSQNLSVFTGTTVDTAVGHLRNFVDSNESGLFKSRFSETLRLGKDKLKLTRSILSFILSVKLGTSFCNLTTLSTDLQHFIQTPFFLQFSSDPITISMF